MVGLRGKLRAVLRGGRAGGGNPGGDEAMNAVQGEARKDRLSDWPEDQRLRNVAIMRDRFAGTVLFGGVKQLALERLVAGIERRDQVLLVVLPLSPTFGEAFITPAAQAAFEGQLRALQQRHPGTSVLRLDQDSTVRTQRLLFRPRAPQRVWPGGGDRGRGWALANGRFAPMIFTTFEYAAFFLVVLLLFHLLSSLNARNWMLLVASYVFYMSWSIPFGLLLWAISSHDYFTARQIAAETDPARRKRLLLRSLCVNLGALGFFKYAMFLWANVTGVASWFSVSVGALPVDIILPVGISFFTFQSMSYTVDVYWRKMEPATRWRTICSMSHSSRNWWPDRLCGLLTSFHN
jgi:hypothetical protein